MVLPSARVAAAPALSELAKGEQPTPALVHTLGTAEVLAAMLRCSRADSLPAHWRGSVVHLALAAYHRVSIEPQRDDP